MVNKRYMGEEKEKKKNHVLKNIAKIGSLIGEGVMEYRDFSMIGKSVSNLSSNTAVTGSVALSKDNYKHSTVSDAGAFMQKQSNGLGKNAYVSRKLRGGFDDYIQEKKYKKLENYIRRNIKKKQTLNKRLSQKNMEFTTRYYNEFHKRNMWGLNKFEYEATQLFRQNKILEKLQKLSSIKNNGGDKILKALIQYYNQNKGIFNSPAVYINDFIKQLENGKYAHKVKFLGDTQRNVFQKQMLQTLGRYKDIKKIFEENKGTILPQAKAIETAYAYEFIKDAINQTDILMTYLKKTGFNYTTLKDAEKFDIATKRRYGLIINDIDEKGNEKSIDITGKLRKFLDNNKCNDDLNTLLDKKGISFDFENKILDSNLYTHAKTGEMIDNRYLKAGAISAIDSFQERVEAPLFINDSTDLTSWQAFYSSLSKEELQVLVSGQVHKFASNLGDKGFDSVTKTIQEGDIRNPLNNNGHFYTSGNVFRYTESGVGDLINEGFYLTPLQFGAFSRMDKSYARSGYKEEVTDRDASQVYEDNSVEKFVRRTLKYINPSKGFISLNEAAVDKSLPTLMEFMIPTFDDDVVRISAIEKLRRSFHQFDLRALDNETGVFSPDVVKEYAKNKGILSELDIKNIKGLETLNEFLGFDNIHTIDVKPREARVFLEDVINNDKDKVSFISTKLVSDSGISKVGKAIVSEININDLKSSGAIDVECDLTFNTKDSDWRLWPQLYEGNTVVSQNQIITGEEMTNMGARRIISRLNNIFVPQVREGEREINQYFYIYRESSKSVQSKESVRLEAFFDDADGKERKNKGLKGYSIDKKKTLSWAKKMGYGDTEAVKSQINELFDGLEDISSTKEPNQAGKYISLAIKYRQEYEGIFYSMGETEGSDSTSLMGALTPKGQKYIPRFFETNSSKEGQEILRYVPEDTKGISQDSWGLRVDKQEGIEDYFNTHYLPTENWTGWNASTNLDGIKIKVMQKTGGNPATSGDWSKDQTRAEKTGEKVIPIHSLSSLINIGRLRDVLLGMGLSDVDVQLTTSYGEGPGGINTSIDIMKDVKNEILDGLNAGVHSSLF